MDVPLRVEGLTRRYKDGARDLTVLSGLSLTVKAGEVVAVVGRSGSGKSTLLHLLGLLDRPDEGEVWIEGMATGLLSEGRRTRLRARRLGFVFQQYHMIDDLTVAENVMLASAAGGGGFRARERARAMDLLEKVGLADRADRFPARLSGGERQRVAIARALVTEPAVVLCDEPTGSLDQRTAGPVLDLFLGMRTERAVVLVTHEAETAARADRVLTLEDGRLREGR